MHNVLDISLGQAFMPLAISAIGVTLPDSRHIGTLLSRLCFAFAIRAGCSRVHRRQLGFWPNSYRLIRLAWTDLRGLGTTPFWEIAARDKVHWKAFIQTWLDHKQLLPLQYYPDLERVDLHGRCLLQVGETFTLLPFRHVPVEQPYPSSFHFAQEVEVHSDECALQVCSDGSSKEGCGAGYVVFLSPYAPIEQAVLAQFKIDGKCTSSKAELRSAIQALKMIRQALPFLHDMKIIYLTDSAYVLQILDEHCQFTCHPNDVHELLHVWRQICNRVSKRHVRGHKGHALNTLADVSAKAALRFAHTRVLYRTVDFFKVFLTLPHQQLPDFHKWM